MSRDESEVEASLKAGLTNLKSRYEASTKQKVNTDQMCDAQEASASLEFVLSVVEEPPIEIIF